MAHSIASDLQIYISTLFSSLSALPDCNYYTEQEFNAKCLSSNISSSKFSLFHLNIRSLNANHSKLFQLMTTLNHDYDAIILSEIWSFNITMYQNLFPHYNFYYVLPVQSSIGGVGAFIRNTYSVVERRDLMSNSMYSNGLVETLFLELSKGSYQCCICCLYRHPNTNIVNFTNALEIILQSANCYRSSADCFLAGDFNLDLLKFDVNSQISNFIDMLVSYNFLPLSLLPTRITENSATLIDHVYLRIKSNSNFNQTDNILTGNIITDISDHLSSFVILHGRDVVPHVCDRPQIRIFSSANNNKFADILFNYDWISSFFPLNDADASYNHFINVLTLAYEESFPLIRMSRKRYKDKKWVTPAVRKSCETKNRLYKIWITTKKSDDKEKYKNYVKIYNKIIKSAENSYYSLAFNSKINSAKKIWKQINGLHSFNPKRSTINSNIAKLLVDSKVVSESVCMANALNKYFSNIGPHLASSLPISNTTSHFTKFLPPPLENSFICESIDPQDIYNVITKLASKNSSGPDIFNIQLISKHILILTPLLCHIYNISISTGVFPKALKIAKVIPIYKKGVHTTMGNYRPISLLSTFSKIFETIISSRLHSFFTKYRIFNDYQFGFRPKYSTKLALLNSVDEILLLLDQKHYVAGIFFDFAKAFDSIDHTILLKKLHHYGIRGLMLKWLTSYLIGRTQFTSLNGHQSSKNDMTFGVPQGSVLGPLLFLIFINDIGNIPHLNCNPKLFADDTNVFVHSHTLNDLNNKCQLVIDKIADWVLANRLSFNYDKTCYMIFSPNQNNPTTVILNLSLNNHQVHKVSHSRYLGVTIDENLSWKPHIKELCLDLRRYIGIFYKLSFKLPQHTLKLLYFALIYPRILYGIELYANTFLSYLHDLMVINNRLLRLIQHSRRTTPTKDLYLHYSTLPINKLYQLQLLLHAHTLLFSIGKLPEIFSKNMLLNNEIHNYHTRSQFAFHRISCNSTYGSKTSFNMCAKLWNSLPNNLKTIPSLNLFKKNLKSYLIFNEL
jgi:hypothetical protein